MPADVFDMPRAFVSYVRPLMNRLSCHSGRTQAGKAQAHHARFVRVPPERWVGGVVVFVLLLDLALGVALARQTVPFSGFDEPWHWMRSEQISYGGLLPIRLGPNDWGGKVDKYAQYFGMLLAAPITKGQAVTLDEYRTLAAWAAHQGPDMIVSPFSSTATYTPLAYLPNAAGLALVRAAGGGLIQQAWGGRMAALFIYIALCALTVWLLPAGRLAALIVLSAPTAIYLATSFSADPLNLVLPALLMAWCLQLRLLPTGKLPRWQAIILLALAIAMGLLKITSVVFAGALLLVPRHYFTTRTARVAFISAGVAGAALLGAGWNIAVPFIPGIYWHKQVDPGRVLSDIVHHPLGHAAMMAQTVWKFGWFLWHDGYARFGGGPGPYHFIVGGPWCALALIVLLLLALGQQPRRRDPVAAVWMALLAVANVASIFTAFRVTYTPPGSDTIEGLQGRYFLLPVLMLLVALSLGVPAIRLPRSREHHPTARGYPPDKDAHQNRELEHFPAAYPKSNRSQNALAHAACVMLILTAMVSETSVMLTAMARYRLLLVQ